MKNTDKHTPARLPDAELAVMQALWGIGRPAARPELDAALESRGWGPTTVLNLIARLEGKGFLSREKQGKGYLYTARISREQYLEAESAHVLQRAFEGSAKQFIAALYAGQTLSQQDLSELEAYLHQLQKGG